MKFNILKSFLPVAVVALMLGGLSSCIGDLDVESIDPQKNTELNQDALFNKIYASFALTGQTGPDGNKDIDDVDEGRSDFFRTLFYLNEFPSDEAHWVWMDNAGVPELLHNTWGESCVFSAAMYYRLYFTITLCNFYLSQASGAADQEMRNAEVRFIRALNYYYVMDLYGKGAFTTVVSDSYPEAYTRQQLFDFVEQELKECASLMAEPGQNTYGRADRVAAWNLLARLYLNAEVYTGTPRWQEALDYADDVIHNGYYHLNTTGATNPVTDEEYSPYQMLFLSDNNKNGAQYENLLVGMFDDVRTKSHGGTQFLIQGSYTNKADYALMSEYAPSGVDNSWGKNIRLRKQLIEKFFPDGAPQEQVLADFIDAAGDDRALFFGYGLNESIEDESTDEVNGFNCVKFRNVNSDGSNNNDAGFVNTDLPLMRIAEAYLTYAEASTRLNGVAGNTDAKEKIDALRDRAHASRQSSYSLDDICDEWAREFWMEGRRRMDLIRFGKFGGQAAYKWEWMGGTYEGNQFPAYMSIYPLPVNELSNNPNLQRLGQNPGY